MTDTKQLFLMQVIIPNFGFVISKPVLLISLEDN